ncbi:MAG: lysophospholipid acyltransferase family protein [Fimbriimonas ginsengisoli]|uniref:Lysophospholipid acyltransferase family protein n=1 Tax=Fimbriimonas ginsengisoli TaxID=1005039 RepID=A0A931LR81_FIMGI|nr:lysophospholipid acyltransferase family protein [Fimbriimonas ginsengisoli]
MAFVKAWWRRARPAVLSNVPYWMVRLLGSTWRIKMQSAEALDAPGGKIICGWHGRSLVAAVKWRGRGVWVIISQSRDGEIQSRVFRRLGFNVIRGSSGRGGVRAAVEGIRVLEAGGTMAITPDGPRGPSGVVQGGVMLMAQRSGAALIPVGISARPRFLAGSWDRFQVPWPFSRAVMRFGPPFRVPREASPADVEVLRQAFEAEIHRIQAEAEREAGHASLCLEPRPGAGGQPDGSPVP